MEFASARRRYSVFVPGSPPIFHELMRFSDTGTLSRTPNTEVEVQICGSEPDVKTAASRMKQYLKDEIFPMLSPAVESMLKAAKSEKCFEKRLTKFRPLDFLTEHLYRNNPLHPERGAIQFEDIPFVADWLKINPRGPLPKFLLWTEEEAAVIIQSHYRGYLVRRMPEVQEMRHYQKMLEGRVPALTQPWMPTKVIASMLPRKPVERTPTPWEACSGFYAPPSADFTEGCDYFGSSGKSSDVKSSVRFNEDRERDSP